MFKDEMSNIIGGRIKYVFRIAKLSTATGDSELFLTLYSNIQSDYFLSEVINNVAS